MKKAIIIIASALALGVSAFAQETSKPSFKWYGFIRNYMAYDSRESTAGTGDLYYYMPKDQSMVDGEDMNAVSSFRFLAITSRLGLDVTGYQYQDYKVGAKIETDFYSGISGVTGTATLRLRQAYLTVGKDSRTWKIGQAWHPMAADMPDIFSLETGVPFGPFSRTPQVNFETKLDDKLTLTAAALWQMQYTSTGPSLTSKSVFSDVKGEYVTLYNYNTAVASADYIKYACTPELYLGITEKFNNGGLIRFGADLLSIKPRNYDYDPLTGKKLAKVDDCITTWNLFQYGMFKTGDWTIKEKVVYANDGSHFNLIGGYGQYDVNDDGSWEYCATRNVSSWASFQYKVKNSNWVPSLFVGYVKNFGTPKDVFLFWCKNSADKIESMYRIQPEILYNMGKLQFGAEYMMTSVHYGTADNLVRLADTDLHWVTNNRIQLMVKYTF